MLCAFTSGLRLYLCEVKGSIVCISLLTALMLEPKTKYTHQGLVLDFSGELQHDNIQSTVKPLLADPPKKGHRL